MEPVGVLPGVDGVQHLVLVDVLWERQLHQEAVDLGVLVEFVHHGQELLLGGVRRENDGARIDPQLVARFPLVSDVLLGRGVLAHEDDGQAGNDPLGPQVGDLRSQFLPDPLGDLGPADDLGRHVYLGKE